MLLRRIGPRFGESVKIFKNINVKKKIKNIFGVILIPRFLFVLVSMSRTKERRPVCILRVL